MVASNFVLLFNNSAPTTAVPPPKESVEYKCLSLGSHGYGQNAHVYLDQKLFRALLLSKCVLISITHNPNDTFDVVINIECYKEGEWKWEYFTLESVTRDECWLEYSYCITGSHIRMQRGIEFTLDIPFNSEVTHITWPAFEALLPHVFVQTLY